MWQYKQLAEVARPWLGATWWLTIHQNINQIGLIVNLASRQSLAALAHSRRKVVSVSELVLDGVAAAEGAVSVSVLAAPLIWFTANHSLCSLIPAVAAISMYRQEITANYLIN